MPNLKVLRIDYQNKLEFSSKFAEQLLLQSLEIEIERNPFPEGTKLEMISVDQVHGLFCNHLVNQNRQLSRLQISYIDFNGNCVLFLPNKLANLRQLSLNG